MERPLHRGHRRLTGQRSIRHGPRPRSAGAVLLLLPGVGADRLLRHPDGDHAGVSSRGFARRGLHADWNVGIYPEVIGEFWELIVRSIGFAVATTVLTLLIGFPMAYTIAFHGGRLKNALLLVVILPFFVSFVIRTLNWRMILSDNGIVFGTLKDLGLMDPAFHFLATPASVIFGLTYNFLPFMILPLYVALEKIDRRLIEAATDLYASPAQAFWRVTFALVAGRLRGVDAHVHPGVGDFLNAEIIGAGNPDVVMIGNIIQFKYLNANDYPAAAAWLRAGDRGDGDGRHLQRVARDQSGSRADARASLRPVLFAFTGIVVLFLLRRLRDDPLQLQRSRRPAEHHLAGLHPRQLPRHMGRPQITGRC